MEKKIFVFVLLFFGVENICCKETSLNTWLSHLADPHFECSVETRNGNRIGFGNEESEVLEDFGDQRIIETVDCDVPGARWDYKLKVSFLRN